MHHSTKEIEEPNKGGMYEVADKVYVHGLVIHISAFHGGGLKMLLWHLSWAKDHFHVSYVCLGGMYEATDDVYGQGLVIHISAVHGGGLEMSLWHLDYHHVAADDVQCQCCSW